MLLQGDKATFKTAYVAMFQTGIDITSWVRPVCVRNNLKAGNLHLFGNPKSEDSDLDDIHLYQVL